MKKVLLILASLVSLAACDDRNPCDNRVSNQNCAELMQNYKVGDDGHMRYVMNPSGPTIASIKAATLEEKLVDIENRYEARMSSLEIERVTAMMLAIYQHNAQSENLAP